MKLLLIGYYGYENIGDEVLLSAILSSLKKQENISCKVLTYNSKKTKEFHNIEVVSRSKNLHLLQEIKNADIVVVGGGSILQDATTSRSLYYYLAILFFAKLLRKRVYFLGNGIGPINKYFNKLLIKFLIPKIDGIISRDKEAYDEFVAYGAKRIEQGVDLAYSYDFKPLDKHPVNKYVIFSLRPWANIDNIISVSISTIEYLIERDYDVFLMPMKSPDDTKVFDTVINSFSSDRLKVLSGDYDETIEYYSNCEFVIGMRLHSLIFSAIMNKPFIGLSYDPKVDSYVNQVLGKSPIDVQNICFDELKGEIDYLIDNYDEVKSKIIESTLKNKERSKTELEHFKKWINN